MLVGWTRSNVTFGTIEAVLVDLALGLLQVPGVVVWAALAFFAELVPKVGVYIMAIPPVLVALAVDAAKVAWVAVFYIAMTEVMSDLVTPRVRASSMNLHPGSVLFVMLAMASAFGILGALIATPVTAFIKAYFEAFYAARQPADARVGSRVEAMIRRDVEGAGR